MSPKVPFTWVARVHYKQELSHSFTTPGHTSKFYQCSHQCVGWEVARHRTQKIAAITEVVLTTKVIVSIQRYDICPTAAPILTELTDSSLSNVPIKVNGSMLQLQEGKCLTRDCGAD